MAIPLTVNAWELVRLHLHNCRQPPYSKPSKPISGDGKSHSTNFCDRSIIMQTAVWHTSTFNHQRSKEKLYFSPLYHEKCYCGSSSVILRSKPNLTPRLHSGSDLANSYLFAPSIEIIRPRVLHIPLLPPSSAVTHYGALKDVLLQT